MSKMKPAVLCVEYGCVIAHSEANPNKPSIALFSIDDVPRNAYHFINRRVCDTVADAGLFHDIAREFPQLLVYVTIQNEDGNYMSYSRGSNGGETRLAEQYSIGIGGHTDLADVVLDLDGHICARATLARSVSRELSEEVGLVQDIEIPQVCKIITDFQDPTSSVHIGVWVNIQVNSANIQKSEEIPDSKWLSATQLFNNLESYEPWSKLIIQHIQ